MTSEGQPHFTIAGIPIRIEWSFWLIAVFLGYRARTGWLLAAWVVIVLVSILVHELGHAVALRIYHQRPRVVLHAFGGLTYGSSAYRSRAQSIVVSAAGPFTAFFILGVPAYFLQDSIDLRTQYDLYVIAHDVAWVNISWSIVNLLPILPLDGGNIAASIIGRPTARVLSMVVAFAAAAYFFQSNNQFAGFFLMMFAIMNFGSYQQEKAGGASSVPTPQARIASLAVPSRTRVSGIDDRDQLEGLAWSALRTGDVGGARRALARHPDGQRMSPFLSGSLALAEGRVREGIDALSAGYAAQPSGPASLVPAQLLARSGQAAILATRLLAPNGAGPQAASGLQSHLHYADCFRESAEVGELVYVDGRANRAQAAFEVACARARTGDRGSALSWVGRAIDAGFGAGALLDGEPDLHAVRLLPEWAAARARVT